MQDTCHYQRSIFNTALGWMGILAREETLCGMSFGNRTAEAARERLGLGKTSADVGSAFCRSVKQRFIDYADGAPDDFLDLAIDSEQHSEFGITVIERCRRIPYGQTLSYGALASAAGSPGAARAVGNLMRTNRIALVVPCHRVVHADGRIGQFSAPQGVSMKERLLAMESRTALTGPCTLPARRRTTSKSSKIA